MVLATGKPIAEAARDLGMHDVTSLGNWVTYWRGNTRSPSDAEWWSRGRLGPSEVGGDAEGMAELGHVMTVVFGRFIALVEVDLLFR